MNHLDKLHEHLSDRSVWYANWHNLESSSLFHFAVLILTAFFTGSTLVSMVEAEGFNASFLGGLTSQATVNSLTTTLSPQVVAAMTSDLLQLSNKVAASTDPAEQSTLTDQLVQLALKRKNALVAEAKTDPHGFLLNALSPDTVKQLPDAVQQLVEKNVDVQGTLHVVHLDALPSELDKSETRYEISEGVLSALGGLARTIRFDGAAPSGLVTGTKVKVRAVGLENELVVSGQIDQGTLAAPAAGTTGIEITGQPAPVPTPVPQNTLVMMINFTNSTSKPWSASQIAQSLFTGTNSTNAYYQDSSFGNVSIGGDVVGWYTLPITNANCDTNYNTVASLADKAAIAAGIVLSNYAHKIYLYNSRGDCSWGGMGTIGGSPSQAWIFGYNNPALFTHEMGHNLLAHHAQSLGCGSKQIAPYSSCSIKEYGDPSDVMGNSYTYYPQFNGPHKIGEGWLPSSVHLQSVTTSGIYIITPSESNDATIKVLKIAKPDTKDAYYISYRQPIGFDSKLPSSLTSGAMIHVWNGNVSSQTKLIDTSPGDGSFYNASLVDGRSFIDSNNGITVTQQSHVLSGSVTLNIQFGPVTTTSTSTPTTQTTQCTLSAPSLSISPLSQSASSSLPLSYKVSLKNNDSSTCTTTATFALSALVPTGWSGVFTPASLTLSRGTLGTADLVVTPVQGVPNGTYSITVKSSDIATIKHNASTAASYVVFTPVADATAPIVSIVTPANGSKVVASSGATTSGTTCGFTFGGCAGSSVSVSATAQDLGGVASMTLSIDGVLAKTCLNTTSCTYSWSLTGVTAGSHTITAKATDKAGNTSSVVSTVTK